jgi:hypothetical protein
MEPPEKRNPPARASLALVALLGLAAFACAPGDRRGVNPAALGPVTAVVLDARTSLDEPVVVPLLGERLPVIEVEIAGRGKARLVVDSAMEISLLDREFARRCGLVARGYALELSIRTPSGALERVHECARVSRIDIRGTGSGGTGSHAATAFDLDMPLVDVRAILPDADGFLGQDVIGDWALLFDRANARLVVLPSDGLPKRLAAFLPRGTPMESLAVEGERRIMELGFEFGDVATHVVLDVDTGSTATSLPQAALDALGISGGTATESTTLSGKESRRKWKVSGFPLGTQRIELVVQDSAAEHGLLGWDALSQRIFVLDGPGRRVLIEASAVAPPLPAASRASDSR